MKIRIKDTRERAIWGAVFVGVIFFLLVSPVLGLLGGLILPPGEVKNITLIKKNGEVEVSWEKNTEADLFGYVLTIENVRTIEVDKDVDKFLISDINTLNDFVFKIRAKDISGQSGAESIIKVSVNDNKSVYKLNTEISSQNLVNILIPVLIFQFFMFFIVIWVLFFKVAKDEIITLVMFPGINTIPFLIFSIALIFSINSIYYKILFTFVASIVYSVLVYILLLTINILNGSKSMNLPLSQAAKASQFIFSLISTYLILIFVFSSNFDVIAKVLSVSVFVFYFSYSSISMTRDITNKEKNFIKSICIAGVVGLSILILSVWPLNLLYSILAISVIYYILLSLAIESRAKLPLVSYLEFAFLAILITALVFLNSFWGILGSLL